MKLFISSYHGAKIYEEKMLSPDEGNSFVHKIIATATLPGHDNLNVDFIRKSADRKQAIRQVKKAIDRYLEEHKLEEFSGKN